LDNTQRVITWANCLEAIRDADIADSVIRDAVLAAVNAADDWVEANQASYNTALPEPFKTWATPRQKSLVLMQVVLRRFNTSG